MNVTGYATCSKRVASIGLTQFYVYTRFKQTASAKQLRQREKKISRTFFSLSLENVLFCWNFHLLKNHGIYPDMLLNCQLTTCGAYKVYLACRNEGPQRLILCSVLAGSFYFFTSVPWLFSIAQISNFTPVPSKLPHQLYLVYSTRYQYVFCV